MHNAEKLLKTVAETGVISLPQMKLVWEVLQEKMLDQMVNGRESVDLGFAELYPIPYRANWKNGLHDEFNKIGQDFKGKGHDACEEIAKDKGFWAEMSNTRLLSRIIFTGASKLCPRSNGGQIQLDQKWISAARCLLPTIAAM